MAIIDVQLPASLAKALRLPQKSPLRQQQKVLKKLLRKALFTQFGQQFRFDEILLSKQPNKKFRDAHRRVLCRICRAPVTEPWAESTVPPVDRPDRYHSKGS